jgi:hypothetical protein
MTDTMVLQFTTYSVGKTTNVSTPDTEIYIYYDVNTELYHLNGKTVTGSSVNSRKKHVPFAYQASKYDVVALYDFVKLVASINRVDMSLLSYEKLPYDTCDITFDYLENNKPREIVGYDNIKLEYSTFNTNLQMIALLSNPY